MSFGLIAVILCVAALSAWATMGVIAEFRGVGRWPRALKWLAQASSGGVTGTADKLGRPWFVRYPIKMLRLTIGLTAAIGGQALLLALLATRREDLGVEGSWLILAEFLAFCVWAGYLVLRSGRTEDASV